MRNRIRPLLLAAVAIAVAAGIGVPTWAYFLATSATVSPTVSAGSLSPVTGVTATPSGGTAMGISWSNPASQLPNTNYVVKNTTTNTTVCTVASTANSCGSTQDTSVHPGQSYAYTVQAVLSTDTSWTSAAASGSGTTPDVFALGNIGTQTAGASFTIQLTAQKASSAASSTLVTDTSYAFASPGRSITFSGPGASPAGNNPSYNGNAGTSVSTPVVFTSGVSTSVTVVLDNAASGQQIVATDNNGSSPITGLSNSFTVNSTTTKNLTVSALTNQAAGTIQSVTVSAADQFGNTVAGYAGKVNFTSTDSQAAAGSGLPSSYTFTGSGAGKDNGSHTFANGVTLKTAGSQTVTATDNANSTIKGGQTVTVTAGQPASLIFTHCSYNSGAAGACSSSTALGNPGSMTGFVSLVDAYGNVPTMTAGWSYAITVTKGNTAGFTLTNSSLTVAAPATESATAYTISYSSGNQGTASTTLTATGVASGGAPDVAQGTLSVKK